MFVSNLNQKMSQRFLVLVLLPHVRADIRKNRRLHFALFQVRAARRLERVGNGAETGNIVLSGLLCRR